MSFYTPLHHQNSNQVGVIKYISFFMYIMVIRTILAVALISAGDVKEPTHFSQSRKPA